MNLKKFTTDMNLHFPGYAGLEKPTVLVFSEVVVCLDCGFAEFRVPEAELLKLAQGVAA